MPVITSTNVANAVTKLVAVDALPALLGELVVGNLVIRDFEPVIAQPGDVVNVPATGGKRSIELDSFIEATFQVPDVTKVLAVPDLLQLYMRPAVVALAEKIETDLLGLYSQFTANMPVCSPGPGSVTEAAIDAAEIALFQSKVPVSQPKYLVTDANTYSQLRQIHRFREFQTAGEAGLRALVDGSVGKIKDFYVFRSQFVAKNVAFVKDAICMAIRRLPQPLPGTGAIAEYAEIGNFGLRVVLDYQPNTLAQRFSVGVLYGADAINPDHGVQLIS